MEAMSGHAGLAPLLRLQSDERLAELTSAGYERAFETLVKRHRRNLLRICSRLLPRDGAEDAVQQALLSAHQSLRRRKSIPEKVRPWLNKIAVNAALKQARRQPEDLALDEERVDGVEQPPEAHERRERIGRLVGALGGLPDNQRRALLLRELEGKSHAEIAAELEVSKGAARQLIHRARDSVRTAASALTPWTLIRSAAEGQLDPTRTAEVAAGAAGGGLAAKAVATVLVTGTVAGGVAVSPVVRDNAASGDAAQAESASGKDGSGSGERSGRSGPGSSGSDSSGSGSSGSGSPGSGSSGSGSSGSGGSGSGSSGSGSSGSGSSGSGSSGSGTSGSGSLDSSGSGGSDSSGSGSGETLDLD